MQEFCVVQELEAPSSSYWELHFDPVYNAAFYDVVDIDLEVLEERREGARIEREVRYSVRTPVPALVRPLLPDGLSYVERATFDREQQVLEHTIHPNTAAARTDIRARLHVEDLGAGRSRRIYRGSVSIQVPLIGRRLEQSTVRNIVESQERASIVTQRFLAERASRALNLSAIQAEEKHTP
jgi:hypothetical protein